MRTLSNHQPRYAELRCKTNYSFLRGASHPDELVKRAAELGYAALAIVDDHSLAGVVRAHVAAKELGLKLLIGAEITPVDAPTVLLYAPEARAYARLAQLITQGRCSADKGDCFLRLDDVAHHAAGLLAAVVVPADTARRPEDTLQGLGLYRDVFAERCHLAVSLHHGPSDEKMLERFVQLAKQTRLPLVATNDVHYHEPGRRPLHDVLTAIRHGVSVAELGALRFPNGERYLKSPAQMAELFSSYPSAIDHGLELAERCRFSLDELRYEYPEELCPPGLTATQHLAQLSWAGAKERYPGGVPEKVAELIRQELRLIEECRYEAYFLTVWDVVCFARGRGILCQGRGSAANSAVCYCLGITSVDPDRTDVLFERFVSRERDEPPDIDVDFEHERREEVIQYVYQKYGRDRAGLVAEVITYRIRSAVRDVARALGLSLDRVDRLARTLDERGVESNLTARLQEGGLDRDAPGTVQLEHLATELLGFPRHLSQHVGGFVITGGPLSELVPIENAAMPDRTVIQWDKDDIDALGIMKVDCLALGMLTAIRKCFELIARHYPNRDGEALRPPLPPVLRGESRGRRAGVRGDSTPPCVVNPGEIQSPALPSPNPLTPNPSPPSTGERGDIAPPKSAQPLTLAGIPAEDPAVYDMICRADTVGVFQIESRAQMSMLPRLRPRCFYDLVIEVAIVRPGPIQGDMVHPYLRRRNGQEPVTYANPIVERVLGKTLGVPLFQEQVMRLAMMAAGFTPGEADQLRRAMGAWRRPGLIEHFRTKLRDNMLARGLPVEFAEQLYEQIRGFGEYGFPEAHAASFALLAYISAWLKFYYPAAFAAAILNSQPMGFYAPAQLVRDAREHGVPVLPMDVNHSDWDCTLEPVESGHALRLGFRLLRGFPQALAQRLIEARSGGRFRSIGDFARRTRLTRPPLARLAAGDAFSSLEVGRRAALWQVLDTGAELPLFAQTLFEPDASPEGLPPLSMQREVVDDYATIGLSLKAHPIGLLRRELDALRVLPASGVADSADKAKVRVAGLVVVRQHPATANGTVFITLEDETGIVNLVVWPRIWQRFRQVICGAAALLADGRIERSGSVIHVGVARIENLSLALRGAQRHP